ncbi:MAG: aspartyl protease family protein [Caulobacterales bacterium]|nr:aspartyl protease family protein [Caulobacterales bacterium]
MRVVLAGVLLMAGAQHAAAAPVAQTAEAVLAANHAAVGAMPAVGSVRAEYKAENAGLVGTGLRLQDLATGAFSQSLEAGPVSLAGGYDGKTPWQQDISGVATDQEGGDRIPVAVNEAYRNANLWWRGDRGGAQVSYVGRETEDGHALDHLAVTPRGGGRFDAWFDADSHMLVKTAEPQQFFKTQTLYGDFRREGTAMVAHVRSDDFGTGPSNIQKLTLTRMVFAPAEPLTVYARPKTPPKGGRIVNAAGTVTVPFRLLNNHIYVAAKVNGKGPYTFIVDTGGHTLISPRLAKEAGLTSVGESATSGAGEKTETTGFAHYDEIALGDVRLTDQTGFVTNVYDKAIEGIEVDGMLGFELFARFAVKIDYGAQTMTITDFARFDPKGAGTAVPFVFYDHLPDVKGFVDDMPARFDIDTGSRVEIDLTSPFVAKMKLRDRYKPGISTITGWGVGGASRSYVVRIPSLTLGTVTGKSVVAGLSEAKGGSISDPNYEGNVGSGYLKRYVVTFDYARKIMYLLPIQPQPADAGRFDRSGLWINAADDGFTITSVAAGSPAAEAGLAEGDLITALDGKAATPASLSDARIALRSLPPGTKVALTVKRGGESRPVTLVLRDLI